MFNVNFLDSFLPGKESEKVPFYNELKGILCRQGDLAIHYPNVIRCLNEILTNNHGRELDKGKNGNNGSAVENIIGDKFGLIGNYLEIEQNDDGLSRNKTYAFLRIAALYHDIGKMIRSANHPRLGANIIRNLDEKERTKMVNGLALKTIDKPKSKEHRFSLLCSVIEHHDKFGVVSTGEGSLALFSDILYFRSYEKEIGGIKKNITSVMLINLADIAAVCTAKDEVKAKATKLLAEILKDRYKHDPLLQSAAYQQLVEIWQDTNSYLGLNADKVINILKDWEELINAIEEESVLGNRTKLKDYLIRLDQNPYRTINRVRRLLIESCYTTGCKSLLEFITETAVEATAIGFFGSHQFQDFCTKFAYIVKMDYALGFFKGIVCACIRNKLWENEQNPLRLLPNERKQKIINWLERGSDEQNELPDELKKRLGDLPKESKDIIINWLTPSSEGQDDCLKPTSEEQDEFAELKKEILSWLVDWQKLNEVEKEVLDKLDDEDKQKVVTKMSKIFIRIISEITRRYNYMLEMDCESAYRFGLQMRNLTQDANVRTHILEWLCASDQEMEHVAVTWIADEVTFWSMD